SRDLRFRWGSTIAFLPGGRELLLLSVHLIGLPVPELKPAWNLRSPNRLLFSSFALELELQRAWIGSSSGATMLWDLQAGRELARARFHRNRVVAVAILGERMYSVDLDRKLQLWTHAREQPGAEPTMLIPERSISLDISPLDMAVDPAQATLALLGHGCVQLRELDDPTRRVVVPVPRNATTLA